jgi:Cdc6-like AAA superfamily ATPase
MFPVVSEAAPLGRDRELAEVERFFDRVSEGPRALTLTGPAGIGKTTVWREAMRRLDCDRRDLWRSDRLRPGAANRA